MYRPLHTYLWTGQWNYASTGEILQTGMYRGHYLRICGQASGIMPVLEEFFKLICIGHYLRICGQTSGIMPVLGKFFKLVCIEDNEHKHGVDNHHPPEDEHRQTPQAIKQLSIENKTITHTL